MNCPRESRASAQAGSRWCSENTGFVTSEVLYYVTGAGAGAMNERSRAETEQDVVTER